MTAPETKGDIITVIIITFLAGFACGLISGRNE